ncbi:hypothetical protein B5G09_08715 [Alistipes sp. An54]|uniref:sigma factor-like helix-turn-helix DNA-binding protein n=1 Tax=Alistipes sp. An54 TaxID=1965645 RepID=UPI000B36F663|nr:sigma factor-like helix-turn-helix DNA-binding protein [Alistipes sp. An54]OUN76691.1 hypothetical protein B5G09_08715 [Alistipes sp. An54]
MNSTRKLWRLESSINTLSNEEQVKRLFEEEIIEIYQRELSRMPALTRRVFLASRQDNMTYQEIAEKLNLTVRRVTTEIQRANFLLRKPLKDHLTGILVGLLWM